MSTQVARWCGVAGVLAALSLAVAVLAAGIPPSPDASPASVSHFVANHRIGFAVAAYAGMVTLVLFAFYVVGLFFLLRRGSDAALPAVAALAGLSTAAVGSVGSSVQGAIAFRAAPLGNVAVNTFAWDLVVGLGILVFLPAAAMVGAASLQSHRTGVLPRWLAWGGWLYVVLGILGALSAVSPLRLWTTISSGALALLLLWIVTTGVLIYVRASDDAG